MRSYIVSSLLALAALTVVDGAAHAQPVRRMERNHSAAEVARSNAQAADDARDLARFQRLLMEFDGAVARRDAVGVRAVLQRFVVQGRVELAEQQRETAQAAREVHQSNREARRDGRPDDRRDARDDRRDLRKQAQEERRVAVIVSEVERIAGAEIAFGPQPGIIARARQLMVEFNQLAAQELRRSQQEVREDRRELREDQRAVRRARGF